jgi:O-antigen/teichoic acid export membrane protein
LGAGKLLAGRVGGVAGSLVAGQLLVGLTYVLAARSMPPAGLGLVATCFAIGTIGATVFDIGLTNYLVREVAADKVGMGHARALVSAKRRLTPVLVVPTMAACLLIMPSPVQGVVLGLTGLLVWESQTANSLLRALEQFSRAASVQVVARLLGLIATAVLLLLVDPELALSVGLAVSFAVEAALDHVFLGSNPTRSARVRDLGPVHRSSFAFGLVSLSAAGQQLDTPLVTAGGGLAAGGLYAGAGRLIGPLLFLSSALALVGAPWLARAQQDPAALRVEERRISRFALGLALVPLAAAALGPTVVPWILGAQYAASGVAFSVLAVGGALSTLSQGMATILQNRGHERTVGVAIAIGLVLGLVATFVLAFAGGAIWAAAGYTLSQAYIVGHLGFGLRRVRNADR